MKIMSWIPLPVKLSGPGYVHLMQQAEGPAVFGCFVAILEAAAQSKNRGELWQTALSPHSPRTLAAVVRQSEKLVEKTLLMCNSEGCDWLETVEIESKTPNCGESAESLPDTCGESAGKLPSTTHRTHRTEHTYSTEFLKFWEAYPKKVGKGSAWIEWQKIPPPLAQCLKTLEWQKQSRDWTKEDGKYIVDPERWIKRRRWEDEDPASATNPKKEPPLFPHY